MTSTHQTPITELSAFMLGKHADFVFADKDPFTEKKDDVWKIKVTDTFFEGNAVYSITK